MSSKNALYMEFKPIIHTYFFELKKQWKKFVIFSIVTIALMLLGSYLPYIFPGNRLAATQADYFRGNLNFLSLIIIFACCFFFAGIICGEYDDNTGFIVFPKINKFKLVIGKFLGSFTLVIGVTTVFYFSLGLLGFYYYGGPIVSRYFVSYGIAILYIFAVGSFVTFFSSFLKTENMTIVSSILILLIGFNVISQFVTLANPDIEPLYSIQYVSNLMSSVLLRDFPTTIEGRYQEFSFQNFTFRTWTTPTVLGGITIMLLYAFISLLIASILFNRRQL